jgi:hypothetical protein
VLTIAGKPEKRKCHHLGCHGVLPLHLVPCHPGCAFQSEVSPVQHDDLSQLESAPCDSRITLSAFLENRLEPEQLEYLLLEARETFEQWMAKKQQAAMNQARDLVASTLTEDWRRLIGPAARLVETLMLLRVESELETGRPSTGHVFASQAALAARIGVTPRTLRNWLSRDYSGAKWLAPWVSRRTWYATRSDGFRCRGGTLWRVSLEAKPCTDLTAAPKPSYEALRTPWRSYQELPGFSGLEDGVPDNKGNSSTSEKNVPKKAGMFEIRVEGRHQTLFPGLDPRCFLNSGNTLPSAARARNSSTWLKAETVAKRLNDRSSTAFWFKQLRNLEVAGLSDGAIWSAVGQALEARASGTLRTTPGAYAVGVLRRTARA